MQEQQSKKKPAGWRKKLVRGFKIGLNRLLFTRQKEPAAEVSWQGDTELGVSGDLAVRQKSARYYGLDIPFLITSLLLLAVGLIMMYSASYSWGIYYENDPAYYITKQLRFAAYGIVAVALIAAVDYRVMKKYWFLIAFGIGTFILLLMVQFYGTTSNGAKRWLKVGGSSLQPSEFAKLCVILVLAKWYEVKQQKVKTFYGGVLPLLAVVFTVDLFLILQKHMSALILVTLTAAAIAFYAGVRIYWFGIFGGLGLGGVYLMVNKLERFSYIRNRIAIFKNPFIDPLDTGYQTIQSMYAVSSGGLWGVGLGNGMQKLQFLPESQNDYIFAVVCEELGLVGAVCVILLFAAFIISGFRIAFRVRDTFGKLTVAGIMTLLALQILLNIMVVINAFPVTGVSLPFFSSGGSSLLVIMIEVGIVLSVSRQAEKTY